MNAPTMTSPAEVLEKAGGVFARLNAMALASTGAPGSDYSPWVLGAYFVHDGPDLLFFLEKEGKTMKNITHTRQVAYSVSENDAMKDFVQGRGEVRTLPESDHDLVMQRMLAKMPWFQLYTPTTPCRIVTHELLVSSFASHWFPARRWAR